MTKDAIAVTTLTPGLLTVCTYGGFAPVCYKNDSGKLDGLDISFLRHFAKNWNLDIKFIEQPFNNIWQRPGENECDIAAAGIQQRVNRKIGDDACWSDSYFDVQRSLLVCAADKPTFDDYINLKGKKIIVTEGSTADIDANERYKNKCEILYVSKLVTDQDPNLDVQKYIVEEFILKQEGYAFGEGNVSNQYLSDKYGHGSLALADVHHISSGLETFNFVTRKASTGLLEKLNAYIKLNKDCYTTGKPCHPD